MNIVMKVQFTIGYQFCNHCVTQHLSNAMILADTNSCYGSTGEASSVDEYLWLMGRARYKPVIEYCGGTEIGGGFISGSLVQPQSLAAFSTAAMGSSLFILGQDGLPLVSLSQLHMLKNMNYCPKFFQICAYFICQEALC